jgi:hypothetical protein
MHWNHQNRRMYVDSRAAPLPSTSIILGPAAVKEMGKYSVRKALLPFRRSVFMRPLRADEGVRR